MSVLPPNDPKVRPEDIQAKLNEIQGDAMEQVEEAKSQLLAVGIGIGIVLLLVAFLLGRRRGQSKATVIEVRRH